MSVIAVIEWPKLSSGRWVLGEGTGTEAIGAQLFPSSSCVDTLGPWLEGGEAIPIFAGSFIALGETSVWETTTKTATSSTPPMIHKAQAGRQRPVGTGKHEQVV